MIAYLDFDGTVVEHEYPKIGRENFGWETVVRKLMEAGHTVILNTYRVHGDKERDLIPAVDYVNNNPSYEDFPRQIEVSAIKIHPDPWNWQRSKSLGRMFIDDQQFGCPLKPAVMANGYMVDWDEVDRQCKAEGLYI